MNLLTSLFSIFAPAMELKIKKYNELSTDELYEILRLRSAIFVVEQNCAYQDMDHADQRSIHLWLEDNEGIVAYGRVVEKGVFLPEVAIGRIISLVRRKGLATQIVKKGIEIAQQEYQADRIMLEAQVYARSLYEKCGFRQCSEEFLEDGMPHIKMLWIKE